MKRKSINARVFILFVLRIMLFVVSGASLACHAVQLSLLNHYPTSSDNPAPPTDWWPEYVAVRRYQVKSWNKSSFYYYQYTLYYVAHGFSCLCALILITFQRKTIRPDRIFSIVNAALTIAVLVYGSLSAGNIPWVGFADTPWQGPLDHTQKGLATYCSDYTGVNDAMITLKRCWLQNGTWLGLVIIAALWCALGLFVYIQTSSMIFRKDEFALVTSTYALDHHPSQAIMTPSPSEEATRHFEPTMPLATNGAEYPIYNNAYDSFDAFKYPNHPMQPYIPHLQGRQMSGSFDSSGSNSMYHNIPPYGYYSNYEEKVAVSTPLSELSVSELPHSRDDARV